MLNNPVDYTFSQKEFYEYCNQYGWRPYYYISENEKYGYKEYGRKVYCSAKDIQTLIDSWNDNQTGWKYTLIS